jgi:hypothetical protein
VESIHPTKDSVISNRAAALGMIAVDAVLAKCNIGSRCREIGYNTDGFSLNTITTWSQ